MKRIVVIVLMITLIGTGCSLLSSGQGKEEITTEARFEGIRVKEFVQNRLVFEGTRKGGAAIYTYDMNQRTLSHIKGKTDWQQENDRIHYLGDNGKITLESGEVKERLIWTDADGKEQELVQTSDHRSLQFSVAPSHDSVLYWTAEGNKTELSVYNLERDERERVADFSEPIALEDVTWSANGHYVMVKQQKVYKVPSGQAIMDIKDGHAVWSPTAPELLVLEKSENGPKLPKDVDKEYGNRIIKVDVLSGEKEQLFPLEGKDEDHLSEDTTDRSLFHESDLFILDQLVWDERGHFFAFVTGRVNGDQVYYEKVHIMDSQGGFHHVENEQNLRPSTIDGMSFSPHSDFFSYTASGLLKVLYLPIQKSKVFDVYTQMRHEDNRYLVYSENDVWVLANDEIKRLGNGLEEKTVYRSPNELMQFFVSANGENLLIIERESDQYVLKLIALLEQEEESATSQATLFHE